jgi:hypothetical protein
MKDSKQWYREMHSPDILICDCLSLEHQIVFLYDSEDNELICEVHLSNYLTWPKRIYHAVKYIFGYRSCYGNFDSTIISSKNKHQFQKALDRIK